MIYEINPLSPIFNIGTQKFTLCTVREAQHSYAVFEQTRNSEWNSWINIDSVTGKFIDLPEGLKL